METHRRIPIPFGLLLIAILSISSITCGLHTDISSIDSVTDPGSEFEPGGWANPQSGGVAAAKTDQAELLAQIGLTQTAVAAIQAAREAAGQPPVEPPAAPPAAHPPVILSVEFPRTVPANGTLVDGTIHCTDAGHDVNWVHFQTLIGSFASGSWEPGDSASWAGDACTIVFQTSCGGSPQHVEASVILQDTAGNRSAPGHVAFDCK